VGCLAREGGIDKSVGKMAQVLSLWRQLLSGIRERYPFSDDFVYYPGKWTNIERGIQYLMELAMQELVYYEPDSALLPTDQIEVQCTRLMWRKFLWSAPMLYASSMAVMD